MICSNFGKHKLNGSKVKLFVFSFRNCIECTKNYSGPASDFKIVFKNSCLLKQGIYKSFQRFENFSWRVASRYVRQLYSNFGQIKVTKKQQKHFNWSIQRKHSKNIHRNGLLWNTFLGISALYGPFINQMKAGRIIIHFL